MHRLSRWPKVSAFCYLWGYAWVDRKDHTELTMADLRAIKKGRVGVVDRDREGRG